MKFAKLYLKSFGPFTGKWLNFEQAGSDLHLIYGPNEAGKLYPFRGDLKQR
jgi:uncharacterized protein YhaN